MDILDHVAWLWDIPVQDWNRLHEREDWDAKFRPFAEDLLADHYPGCHVGGMGLWLVEPGQSHAAHTDIQPDEWVVRIHVPLATNGDCVTMMPDGDHYMKIGRAYRFNTLAMHAVANRGQTRRIHLVIDVCR